MLGLQCEKSLLTIIVVHYRKSSVPFQSSDDGVHSTVSPKYPNA